MVFEMTPDIHGRMHEFFDRRIGRHLLRPEQRASFATYALGIVGDGERKSAEPIAARVTGDAEECRQMHDRLLWFLSRSTWSDRLVRREAAWYAIEALQERESVRAWILDDTGFLKRWRTERAYEDLKGELGLDHFEGRSFPGWNHQVSVVLCCYAFIVGERSRHFPPSEGRTDRDAALGRAA